MTEFERIANEMLVDTFNFILRYEENALKTAFDVPTTIAEVHLVDMVSRLGESATVSAIAAALGVSLPTVTNALKKLEKKGLVTKTVREDDARSQFVKLTETGRQIERGHTLFHRQMVRGFSQTLNESEKEVLGVALAKLSEYFKHVSQNHDETSE